MRRGTHRLLAVCFVFLSAAPALAAVRYNGKALRDPFTDPNAVVAKVDSDQTMQTAFKTLKLQGILYSAENPRAIVNGKIVAIGGDVAGQAKVTAIHRDSVVLSANGKTYTLNETIRKTSDDTDSKIPPTVK